MTAPPLAVTMPDGHRMYRHPRTMETVPSVTSVIKRVAKPYLVPWAARMAAEHAVVNWAELSDLPVRQRFLRIKTAHEVYTEEAAATGDVVHDLIDCWSTGKPFPEWDKKIDPFATSFIKFMTATRPRFIENEFTVWSRKYGYAGTADFLAEIDGKVILGDAKSGKSLHDDIGLQLSALANADFILRVDGTEEPIPKIDGLAGLHIRPRSCKLQPVGEQEACFRAFLAARELLHWEREIAPRVLTGGK